ncbi:synaptotagmin-3 isoform X2 [Vitis vinifera]|uniref:synaptotagmin-3 isoform X2 n=1 Tax=Vitis vinifera TaxID=29760 RepID=UPI00053F33B3|nr:synaptotagmin-3 isoform X2 [Vitis vinifera]|eukprot:XP_010658397.1 PREDICTED: synaptotagmin-3 isoform X2 [Vitis vinifera]
MGFLSSLLDIVGFGIGIPFGLLVGFFLFVYSQPKDVQDPDVRPLSELDSSTLMDLLPELPFWVKNPNYDRVDWLNKFILNMWPYLDKAICDTIRSMAQPIFAEYIGMYQIEAIEFEKLSLGTLPPILHGIKVYETNEKELAMEPAIKWAGNPNIILVLKWLPFRITIQPHVDFGLKILGGDIMSIPGLYRFVQETIKREVAKLYLWPQTLEIPILDAATGAIKKPVGILHVKVVRALKLLKMDFLGASDPYVKLSLSGERLPAKKTTVKRKNLNPEWNEKFKLIVRDPQAQVLQLYVYDWDKVGAHDKLGMQLVPLKLLTPHETQEFTLDLFKNTNLSDPQQKQRGKIVVELTFDPFKEDHECYSGPLDGYGRKESRISRASDDDTPSGAGLLLVTIQGAEDVEGQRHNNPYAVILFRGEKKKTKMMKKTRDPQWNEEFQFMLEEPPLSEKIHIQVISQRSGIGFRSKESMGHVDIDLTDVVHNGRINHKYHLINSKNGQIHLEIKWKMI